MSGASTARYAVVTGANKGIGFETVRQLALTGVTVILTARDEKRGREAFEKLKEEGLSDKVIFHQLDVATPASIASLADFVNSRFGKLDILVNNAGTGVHKEDIEGVLALLNSSGEQERANASRMVTPITYEFAKECLETNYYGAKRTAEALFPLLHLSDSPRIVNVSSSAGKLERLSNEWAKKVLSDAENLTEDKIEEVLIEFLKDVKEGSLESKGWPTFASAYSVSKAAMNADTRILAKKHPNFLINCVCPGFVKTDINFNMGFLPVEEGAASPVRLALLPNDGPTGLFFDRSEVSPF